MSRNLSIPVSVVVIIIAALAILLSMSLLIVAALNNSIEEGVENSNNQKAIVGLQKSLFQPKYLL